MRLTTCFTLCATLLLCALPPARAGEASGAGTGSGTPAPQPKQTADYDSPWAKDPEDWRIAIYPIYAWLPVFGANVNYPNISIPPGGGNASLDGRVSGSFNGAFFSGFEIGKSRVVTHGDFMYASVSADNTRPIVHIAMRAVYGSLMGGYEIIPNTLSLEGGARRLALKIDASVDDGPGVSTKPGLWDPLIGISWKHQLARKWMLKAHVDGGGFGVGSDVDVGATIRADWRFARHFGLTLGGSGLHFQFTRDILQQTSVSRQLKFRQTLYGPVFGFGIYF